VPITIKELARLAGVSVATVSVVINRKDRGAVSPAKRDEVLRLAKKFNYRPNIMAKGLIHGRTLRIAVCLEEGLPPMFGGLGRYERVRLFAKAIAAAGYAMEIHAITPDLDAAEIARALSEAPVDGFIFSGVSAPLLDRLCFSMREKRIPAVCPGAVLNDEQFTWTDVDHEAVFDRITQHLIGEGHTRIALIHGSGHYGETSQLNTKGYLGRMKKDLGVDVPEWVFTPSEFSCDGMFRTTQEVLEEMPGLTAIILAGNFYYEVVLLALRLRGITPGRDFRIIGAGTAPPKMGEEPRLSHYSFQVPEQVSFCMNALLEQIENFDQYEPRHKLFEGEYIQGDT